MGNNISNLINSTYFYYGALIATGIMIISGTLYYRNRDMMTHQLSIIDEDDHYSIKCICNLARDSALAKYVKQHNGNLIYILLDYYGDSVYLATLSSLLATDINAWNLATIEERDAIKGLATSLLGNTLKTLVEKNMITPKTQIFAYAEGYTHKKYPSVVPEQLSGELRGAICTPERYQYVTDNLNAMKALINYYKSIGMRIIGDKYKTDELMIFNDNSIVGTDKYTIAEHMALNDSIYIGGIVDIVIAKCLKR